MRKQEKMCQAIEQLHFTVKPDKIEDFIRLDAKIWSEKLSKYKGFVKKETWVSDDKKGEIYTLTYWENMSDWEAIDKHELMQTAQLFDEAMGSENYVFNKPLHVNNQKYKILEYRK